MPARWKTYFLYLHIKNVTFVIRKVEGKKNNNLVPTSVNSAVENIYSLMMNFLSDSFVFVWPSRLSS